MRHKLVIFDWNGTILSDTIYTWKAANECLMLYDAEPISYAVYKDTFTFPVIHFYKQNGISIDKILEKQDEVNAAFHRHYSQMAANARTRRGARDILDWLQMKNISTMILSNYMTTRIQESLQRLKIEEYFHHVSGHEKGDEIMHKTSKLERLSDFLVKRGYKPSDAVIIGDSLEEPEIAERLGLTSISITGGTISEKRLRKANADYTVHALTEMQPILQKLWNL